MLLAEFYKRQFRARPPSRHSPLVRCIQSPCAPPPPPPPPPPPASLPPFSSPPFLCDVTPGGRDYLGISARGTESRLRRSGGPSLTPSPVVRSSFARGCTRRDLIDGARPAGLSSPRPWRLISNIRCLALRLLGRTASPMYRDSFYKMRGRIGDVL